MEAQKSFWAMGKRQQESFLAETTHEAIARTQALGQATCHKDEKGLYFLAPTGEKRYVIARKYKGRRRSVKGMDIWANNTLV
ncbi:hypothetical protein HSX37_06980|uniref:Uncharacterized protein n=1 Tax=Dendrosporobacter quercicolus TaxID=146817 RepID=A0A1G9VVH2_9FIRM|nr:hypothetical protein [Dendrosporobacter quercicolus]NSL47787.1 hypothetical protein [Dendrosporobacter quercicolus DSM 1736]SDM76302.1 hypothetical protein SAMN04488502_10753 [Dendrosporobacter quercicolus]